MDPRDVETLTSTPLTPVPLTSFHNVTAFHCGEDSLDHYLKHHALQGPNQGLSRTWVLSPNQKDIFAYFTLAGSVIKPSDATARVRKGLPSYDIPAILLARLAVTQDYQGQGVGGLALEAAMRKALDLGRTRRDNPSEFHLPCRALLVHALDEKAAAFYAHYGFVPSPTHPLHWMALLKDIEKAFG